ncbi:Uncharacterised protein [Halioglobus japonicus]|nr:Uncharacterised protein [Halioglobus japonicus]
MAHTVGKAQVIKVDDTLAEGADEVMRLWKEVGFNGPKPNFANAVRYLISIGIQFEKFRMLESKYCFSTEQAMRLHAHKMRQGREATPDEEPK